MLTGGRRKPMAGDLTTGYYLEPTILFCNNSMRFSQEEIFGQVLMDEALALAKDFDYGFGAGV